MQLIFHGDTKLQTVLGKKQVTPGTDYRWSVFTMLHMFEGKPHLFNNLSKQIYLLENEAFDYVADARFTADQVSADAALTTLVADGFLVHEDKDEAKAYENYCKLMRAMLPKGYNKYTILPTTACNARCAYCFEAGIPFVSMNDETVEQTIAFIKKMRDPNKPVRFSWFGGEPLMGEKIIDKIVDSLIADGITVQSTMISNGSLITEENIRKMRDKWNLRHIQITLDGTEEQYNQRKNYVFNYKSAYWHVLSRIKMVNENGIRLTIRINIDHENAGGVPTMMDDLKNFITDPSTVVFDIVPLFDLQAGDNPQKIWDRSFAIADAIREKGFVATAHYRIQKTRINFCMADRPYNALVITPDGKLYPCEHVQAVESYGDVWNGFTRPDLMQKANTVEPARPECRDCISLPNCTTFTGCPNHKEDCKYSERRRLERAIDFALRYMQKLKTTSLEENEPEEDEDC